DRATRARAGWAYAGNPLATSAVARELLPPSNRPVVLHPEGDAVLAPRRSRCLRLRRRWGNHPLGTTWTPGARPRGRAAVEPLCLWLGRDGQGPLGPVEGADVRGCPRAQTESANPVSRCVRLS